MYTELFAALCTRQPQQSTRAKSMRNRLWTECCNRFGIEDIAIGWAVLNSFVL